MLASIMGGVCWEGEYHTVSGDIWEQTVSYDGEMTMAVFRHKTKHEPLLDGFSIN